MCSWAEQSRRRGHELQRHVGNEQTLISMHAVPFHLRKRRDTPGEYSQNAHAHAHTPHKVGSQSHRECPGVITIEQHGKVTKYLKVKVKKREKKRGRRRGKQENRRRETFHFLIPCLQWKVTRSLSKQPLQLFILLVLFSSYYTPTLYQIWMYWRSKWNKAKQSDKDPVFKHLQLSREVRQHD